MGFISIFEDFWGLMSDGSGSLLRMVEFTGDYGTAITRFLDLLMDVMRLGSLVCMCDYCLGLGSSFIMDCSFYYGLCFGI